MATEKNDDLPAIGAPAARALQAAGITTLTDVRRHRPEELTALHGVGPKAISVLGTALAERGWTFAGAEDA